MKPKRIRLSRAKGWRLPPNAINVARPGPWGNPFKVGRDGTQQQCVTMFKMLMLAHFCLTSKASIEEQKRSNNHIGQNIEKLRGKDLACWCRIGTPCHADVLLELANAPDNNGGLAT